MGCPVGRTPVVPIAGGFAELLGPLPVWVKPVGVPEETRPVVGLGVCPLGRDEGAAIWLVPGLVRAVPLLLKPAGRCPAAPVGF